MSNVTAVLNLKKLKGYADWNLLLFLLLFLNVKLAVKIPAIILMYLLRFDFKFGFNLKNSRLPLFYPLIIVIALFDFLLYRNYTRNYLTVFLIGAFFWMLCILAIHQVKLSVEKNDIETIHRTVFIFLLINAVVSLFMLLCIIWKTGAINPYTYQGQYQRYFIGTGDFIRGVTFDTSTTNAVLNAFGVIYFFTRKNTVMLLVCMATLLLTGSNFTNIALLAILAFLFLFSSNKDQKSLIVVCVVFLIVFMAKVSPQNNNYTLETIKNIISRNKTNFKYKPVIAEIPIRQRPDSLLTFDEKKEKTATLYLDSIGHLIALKKAGTPFHRLPKGVLVEDAGRIYVPKPDINTDPYQSKKTTPPEQLPLVHFINTHKTILPISGQEYYKKLTLPGKAIGVLQTLNFLKQHPAKILTGDGIGNFSSKVAFKATGLGISGGYPIKYIYINNDFEVNHLDLYLNFFSKGPGSHSLTNSPFSVFDQLLAEYGLLGLFVFVAGYLWCFGKHYKTLTYGLPILVFATAILFIDYWFEQLSVMIFFELLLLLNIKETTVKQTIKYGL